MDDLKQITLLFSKLDNSNKGYLDYIEFKRLLNILELPIIKEDYKNNCYNFEDLVNELNNYDNNYVSTTIIREKLEKTIGKELLDNIISNKEYIEFDELLKELDKIIMLL